MYRALAQAPQGQLRPPPQKGEASPHPSAAELMAGLRVWGLSGGVACSQHCELPASPPCGHRAVLERCRHPNKAKQGARPGQVTQPGGPLSWLRATHRSLSHASGQRLP